MMSLSRESDLTVICWTEVLDQLFVSSETLDLSDGDAAVFVAQSAAVRTKTQSKHTQCEVNLEQVHISVDNWSSRILNLDNQIMVARAGALCLSSCSSG